jgi:two-component system chemotaxis response regulator CheY
MASILAVDDSASMRQMVSFTLRSSGHQVIEAVDGQDALEKIGSARVDLVLTDQNMRQRSLPQYAHPGTHHGVE